MCARGLMIVPTRSVDQVWGKYWSAWLLEYGSTGLYCMESEARCNKQFRRGATWQLGIAPLCLPATFDGAAVSVLQLRQLPAQPFGPTTSPSNPP